MNPLKKVTTQTDDVLLEYVSFINYSLVLLKLADNIRDTKKIKYKLIYKVLSGRKKHFELLSKYREVWDRINKSYDLLYELESNGTTDYDTCSKAMGAVLQEIVRFYYVYSQIEADSVVIKFAEHLGMWIYLIDAYDDLEDDLKRNAFNPLYSFSTKIDEIERKGECFKSGKLMLVLMQTNLLRMMGSISLCRHVDIIKNIVQFGTQAAVKKIEEKRRKRK